MIREATIEDAEVVADIYLASRKEDVPFAKLVYSDEAIRNWVRNILIPHSRVFVAEDEKQVCAIMSLTISKEGGWIDQLYVNPGQTGCGYGSDLLKLAKVELPAPIYLYTFQQNEGARRFYERHGFVAIRFSDGRDNEEHCPDVLYRWGI